MQREIRPPPLLCLPPLPLRTLLRLFLRSRYNPIIHGSVNRLLGRDICPCSDNFWSIQPRQYIRAASLVSNSVYFMFVVNISRFSFLTGNDGRQQGGRLLRRKEGLSRRRGERVGRRRAERRRGVLLLSAQRLALLEQRREVQRGQQRQRRCDGSNC